MGDAENVPPPSKKRVAGRQLSRDEDPDAEEDFTGQETGTFQRASHEVMAARRIVKVRRNLPSSSSAPNPFAAIRLVPPTISASVVGESAAKPPEIALSTTLVGQPPVSQQETSPANDDGSKGASLNSAKGVAETEVAEATLNEDEKGKVEAQSKAAEVGEKNGDAKKESPGEPADTKTGDSKNTSEEPAKEEQIKEEPTKEEQVKEEPTKEEQVKEEPKNDKPKQETSTTVNSFQQLCSTQNAFTGISGTGFSSSTFSFGLTSNLGTFSTGLPFGATAVSFGATGASFGSLFSSGSFNSTGSLFGAKPGNDGPSPSSTSNGGASLMYGVSGSDNSTVSGSGLPTLHEVPLETGEEREKSVFTADAALFEYISGGWKERGKGELKVNVSTVDTGKARLVMRSKGNYRLILNANLYPDMKLTSMDKRGITFACVNSGGDVKEGLATFALKFKDISVVNDFRGAVEAHKGRSAGDLKTPENSPKASED